LQFEGNVAADGDGLLPDEQPVNKRLKSAGDNSKIGLPDTSPNYLLLA
jgi:hypothetical protein